MLKVILHRALRDMQGGASCRAAVQRSAAGKYDLTGVDRRYGRDGFVLVYQAFEYNLQSVLPCNYEFSLVTVEERYASHCTNKSKSGWLDNFLPEQTQEAA